LAWRDIERLAAEAAELAYQRRDDGIDEATLRRKLLDLGVDPEFIPVEIRRVIDVIFRT
jgi:hypothetical protein